MADLAQSGVEQGEDRSRGEFVDPSATGGHVVQWPFVVSLDQVDLGSLKQWLDHASHVVDAGIEHVGVEEHHELRVAGRQAGA